MAFKLTIIGAGSTVFARNVLGDSMMTPALEESVIALYDIDALRLQESAAMLEAINRNNGSKAKIETFLGVENRKEALRGQTMWSTPSRWAGTIPAPSWILRFRRNTACGRPSPIPWGWAGSSGPCSTTRASWISAPSRRGGP